MPDCSAATIRLWPIPDLTVESNEMDEFRAAIDELGADPSSLALKPSEHGPIYDRDIEVDEYLGCRRLKIEDYEAPWGINYEPFQTLRNLAPALGYAYEAEDGGHYTWDPLIEFWHPGMPAAVERSAGQDGDPRMSWFEYEALRKECSDDGTGAEGTVDYLALGRAVAAFFSTLPLKWAPAEVVA